MSENIKVKLPLDDIREYCAGQPIARLSLFGSALRGELTPESDIDLLVEYMPGARITYFRMSRQENELGEIIGWRVDLRTPQELSDYFRQEVEDGARLIYAKER